MNKITLIMKRKILVLGIACLIGTYSAFACGLEECGGGSSKCCTDVFGALYYTTIKSVKVKSNL